MVQTAYRLGDDPSDDGENCWDCGDPDEANDMNLCCTCGHTVCFDCQQGSVWLGTGPHVCGTALEIG
jgi:hypothetical protein